MNTSEDTQNGPTRELVSPWVKGFVAFHLLAITIWAIPRPLESITGGRVGGTVADKIRAFNYDRLLPSPIKFYCMATGFWQYWDMFGPNPSDTDLWVDALVTYRDGTASIYRYPRMADLSIWDKYLKERYRKFYERVNPDADQFMWPHFAQHIAALADDRPGNPPVSVRLRRHFQQIAPPGAVRQPGYQEFVYYTHVVDQAELAREEGRS